MSNWIRLPVWIRSPLGARLPVLVGSCLLSACATIISSPRQSVKIDSVPQGAKVFTAVFSANRQGDLLKRTEVGVTPMTVSITRKDGIVELEKEGYKTTRVAMHRELNPWFLGNVLMTSLVSSMIDSSTGAINEYDPDQYLVELPRDEGSLPAPSATGQVGTTTARPAEAGDQEEPWVPDVRPLSPSPAAPVSAPDKK